MAMLTPEDAAIAAAIESHKCIVLTIDGFKEKIVDAADIHKRVRNEEKKVDEWVFYGVHNTLLIVMAMLANVTVVLTFTLLKVEGASIIPQAALKSLSPDGQLKFEKLSDSVKKQYFSEVPNQTPDFGISLRDKGIVAFAECKVIREAMPDLKGFPELTQPLRALPGSPQKSRSPSPSVHRAIDEVIRLLATPLEQYSYQAISLFRNNKTLKTLYFFGMIQDRDYCFIFCRYRRVDFAVGLAETVPNSSGGEPETGTHPTRGYINVLKTKLDIITQTVVIPKVIYAGELAIADELPTRKIYEAFRLATKEINVLGETVTPMQKSFCARAVNETSQDVDPDKGLVEYAEKCFKHRLGKIKRGVSEAHYDFKNESSFEVQGDEAETEREDAQSPFYPESSVEPSSSPSVSTVEGSTTEEISLTEDLSVMVEERPGPGLPRRSTRSKMLAVPRSATPQPLTATPKPSTP
ncbi:hypothetical protein BD413DRAFT_613576 [Trametes elegans]|nr:hypothetical protein BD413DRAFT_613576 [Trametes elegans]